MEKVVKVERSPAVQYKKKRVAAYARVSSGKDAMLHSLSSQISYYSSLIQRNAEWEYAGVYADEAITGTKDRRPEFQRLLADCRNGKIDIILTKSISRFARNTVTTLQIVRELREYGVDVHFERENLKSLDPDGEFILTILASFAQEESLTASENQKWKIRKNFSEGVTTTTSILGYKIDHGEITVIPEEAAIVRRIFDCYLSGMGLNAIARMLQNEGVPTKHGGRWADKTVRQILSNEKYKGTLLLQKTFSLDHISKKKAVNKGALPQYLVENSHEAIVSSDTFDAVQLLITSKSNTADSQSSKKNAYTGKIVCEKCGKRFRRKITSGGIRWSCSTFETYGKAQCDARKIPETVLDEIIQGRPFKQIRVPENGTLTVEWEDGSVSEHKWQNASRADSWTEEMKKAAAERTKEWLRRQSQ